MVRKASSLTRTLTDHAIGTGERGATDNRQKILEAATAVFAQEGFAGARTRDIAAHAGVQHSLVAYYFGTKETLWQGCAELIYKDFRERLRRVQLQGVGLDANLRLKLLLREIAYAAAHFGAARVFVLRTRTRGAPPLSAAAVQAWEELHDTQTALVRELQEGGALPSHHDPRTIYAIITGAATNFFNGDLDRDVKDNPQDPEFFKSYLDAVFDCLRLN